MARIVGAIATSHTPTIGYAQDRHLRSDPLWAPIFAAFDPLRTWLEERQPDVLLVIYNDHVTSFFFDHYSAFALGVDETYAPADEGGGPRDLPPIAGHAPLARSLGRSLMADEFDLAFFRNRPLDHGCFSPLSMLVDAKSAWPWAIVPLQVGVLQFPAPTAHRCFKLGQALRRAIAAYSEDLKVVIVGTGGLSHQVHGERCGFNNPAWDQEFMDLLETDPAALTRLTHAQYAERGGMEGSEVIMWLIMRGALSPSIRRIYRRYQLPSMTAIATAIYEDEEPHTNSAPFVDLQMAGIESLPGTYPFTLERCADAYRLNAYLHDLTQPQHRRSFIDNADVHMAAAQLTDHEQDLINKRDWRGLVRHGAIFFVLEKLAAVLGISNLHVYAAMRGETLASFQATRKVAIQYSVARQTDQPT
jgi:gallate dioxygenase